MKGMVKHIAGNLRPLSQLLAEAGTETVEGQAGLNEAMQQARATRCGFNELTRLRRRWNDYLGVRRRGVPLRRLRFTQGSVQSFVSDGRSIEQVRAALRGDDMNGLRACDEDLTYDAVNYQGSRYCLNNELLYCLKFELPQAIVQVRCFPFAPEVTLNASSRKIIEAFFRSLTALDGGTAVRFQGSASRFE